MGRRADTVRRLKPIQPISPESRAYSIFGQRSLDHGHPLLLHPRGEAVVADAELEPDDLRQARERLDLLADAG